MKTPHVQELVDGLEARFDGFRVGAWNCRRIAGLLKWSQHAYTEGEYEGNAADIFPWSPTQGDEIAAWLKTQPNIKAVLWRTKNHYDHVHFDTWPTGIGLPPCKGGNLRVQHEDGKIGRTFKEEDLPLNDADKAWITDTINEAVAGLPILVWAEQPGGHEPEEPSAWQTLLRTKTNTDKILKPVTKPPDG